MYQYALLLSLKKIYKNIDIKIDTNHYEKVKSHTGYILDKLFGIKECVASEEECRKVYSGCRYYKGFGREGSECSIGGSIPKSEIWQAQAIDLT